MSRLALRLGVLGLLLSGAAPARSRTPQFAPSVNAEVAAARRVAPEIGVAIVDLASGRPVYTYEAGTGRIAASNTKLVTSAAALDALGPGYFFETEILIRGSIDGGVLAGDLGVVGGGDPHISGRGYEGDCFGPFREWAADLADLGIRRVAGDLVLVHGLFDSEFVHPDWPGDQRTRWYEAPVAALSFNDNCVLVKVRPGARPGDAAQVEVTPPLALFQVESSAATTGSRRRERLSIDRRESPDEEWLLTVAGRIDRRTESRDKWVAVADPLQYFGAALIAALAEEGIEISGRALPSAGLPDSGAPWRRVRTHRTDLLTVLEVLNKRSQNFYAESVLKLLGARLCADGSWRGGVRAVAEFLRGMGVAEGSYRLADGSGMSRNDRFSPEQLTRLLWRMYHHPWGAEFVRTLPYSGEPDLRWSERLADPPYRGNVMAKTGYLAGVSALSGYAKARSGTVYAFSILMSSIRGEAQAKKAQDAIVRAVIDHG